MENKEVKKLKEEAVVDKDFAEKFAELITNDEFAAQLKGLRDREEIKKQFQNNGLDLTDEMMDAIMDKLARYEETGELDEETLSLVSGGFLVHVIVGGVFGALAGGGVGAAVGAVAGFTLWLLTR